MRNLLWILSGVLLVTACNNISSSDGNEDVLSFVNPFIGNADILFPELVCPFGLYKQVQKQGTMSGNTVRDLILQTILSWDLPKII